MTNEEWDGAVLRELAPDWADRIFFLPECGSTNDEARNLALRGAREWTVVLTERQECGRGRRGQRWVCPPGKGLAFSLILRPSEAAVLWSRCALTAGLAIAEGLERFGVSTGLKWPNDVRVGPGKIAGILVEADAEFVVVGVGVNVNVGEFPGDLDFPATSLVMELGNQELREEVLVSCLKRLRVRLGQLGSGFDEVIRAWSERCVLTGRVVTLDAGGKSKTGTVEGISDGGELLLRGVNGVERILQASEIREVPI
ncbi:MAG: biotin--[acetyl-CoA-carboxylase] ligase [Akkermansiaceae bacterium]|jgi:BirA family biotin operon repressor/biotin-[acetyl-CoA-carboxylase] ligase